MANLVGIRAKLLQGIELLPQSVAGVGTIVLLEGLPLGDDGDVNFGPPHASGKHLLR